MKKTEGIKVLYVILTLFCISVALLLPQGVEARIFKVNSTDDIVDSAPGNGICATGAATCTLRAAVQEANAFPGADTIILKAKTYRRTIAGTGEDLAATGDLDITDSVTITGLGAAYTIIDGNHTDRVFHVTGAATVANFIGLKIQNGAVNSGTYAGAGIFNDGATTVVTSCTIKNNISYAQSGGGICSLFGNLKIVSSRVTQNVIYGEEIIIGGGGISSGNDGSLIISKTNISDNFVSNVTAGGVARGGGISISSTTVVKITSCKIQGNVSESSSLLGMGAGIDIFNVPNAKITNTRIAYNTATGSFGYGGGVSAGGTNATFSGCTITENFAAGPDGYGGGLYLALASPGDTSIITISNFSSVTHNHAAFGGGIHNLAVNLKISADSVVSGNTADDIYP